MDIQIVKKLAKSCRSFLGITPEKLDRNFHLKNQKKVFDNYFSKNHVLKLQIGAQSNSIGSWLNVDIQPKSREVAFMDATQPFPFTHNTFDNIFSEHMIEHISFPEGEYMLKECFRVLKRGGKIRIATPNLQFLIDLYQEHKTDNQQSYIDFSKKYINYSAPIVDTVVINNFFRDWGHQFIHDEKTLRYLFEKAGFKNIKRCNVSESDEPAFNDLEQHGKEISEKFNALETIVMEAEKL